MNNNDIFYVILLSFDFKKLFRNCSVLAWIRIELKCWIRIRIESIRIHNPEIFSIFLKNRL
jgi:hypothetical protein